MNIVIDCNIFVMSLSSRSPYHLIYQSLAKGEFNLTISIDIMLEYEEIIQRKYSIATAKALMTLLTELPNVHLVQNYYKWQLIEVDKDDNKYCDCAVAGQAEYIVTEDKHFDVLKKVAFPLIAVIDINRFLLLLKSNK